MIEMRWIAKSFIVPCGNVDQSIYTSFEFPYTLQYRFMQRVVNYGSTHGGIHDEWSEWKDVTFEEKP